MSAQHTQGPWQVLETEPDRAMDYVGETFVRASSGATLATLSNYSPAERRANAAMMAAAPELLEAVQRLLACNIEENRNIPGSAGAIRCARAALAKAAGDTGLRPETTYEKSARWNWPDGRPDL